MNIKKKYSCFSYAGGNIGSAVLLLGAMIALFLLRGKGVSWSATVNIIEKYCDAPLILIAGLLGALTLIFYYETLEPRKISFGRTRKKCFWNMQAGKMLTVLSAGLISFLLTGKQRNGIFFMELFFLHTACYFFAKMELFFLLMSSLFALGFCECMAVLHLRYRQLILIPIVCVSGMMGFVVAYMVVGILKKGEITMNLQMQSSIGLLGLWTVILAGGTLLLALLAWKLFRKAEIHI